MRETWEDNLGWDAEIPSNFNGIILGHNIFVEIFLGKI